MIFAPRSKTKSISTTRTTTKSIWCLHWNQVKFDPPHWHQVNVDHPHKNQVNFQAHLENKWFSASIQVTNQFLPPTQPNQFNPRTEIKSSSIPQNEIRSISAITKTKSMSVHTLRTSIFRPSHKDKINFDPRTKITPISVLTLKPSQFLSSTQNQVNFDLNTEVKSISISSLKTGQFTTPPTRKPS